MAERLHPGVYVEEVSGGVRPIEGVSTSTAAFIGEAPRGVPGVAQFVTSFAEYERAFGGHRPGDPGLLAAAVDGFFAAGGKRAYIVRVLPSGAKRGVTEPPAPARLDTKPQVQSLRFVARGAGKWADAVRINILEPTNFKDDAFRVDVMWTEAGATRRLESFDDVRMDPAHEDYVGERLKTSRYIQVEDLFAQAVDAAPGQTHVAARAPVLTATKLTQGGAYPIFEGKTLTVTWWDVAQPDVPASSQSITFTQDLLNQSLNPAPKFELGAVELTPQQMATLLNAVLTKLDAPANANPPSIGIKVSKAPRVEIEPVPAATWDLTDQTLEIAVNGGQPVPVKVTAATPAETTAKEITDAIKVALLELGAVQDNASKLTVTGKGSDAGIPTLAIASKPDGERVRIALTPAAEGTRPTVKIEPKLGATWDLTGQELEVTVNNGAAVVVKVTAQNEGETNEEEIAAAIKNAINDVTVAFSAGEVTVTGKGSYDAVPTLTIVSMPENDRIKTSPTAGTQGTKPIAVITPGPAATWDLSGDQKLRITVDGGTPVDVTVQAENPAKATAAEIAGAIKNSSAGVGVEVISGRKVQVTGKESAGGGATLTVAATPIAARIHATSTPGAGGITSEHFGGLRMTLSESISATAPAVLRALGFRGSARGYAVNSPANPDVRPALANGLRLIGGSDGSGPLTASDYEGDARERTGLHALDGVDVNLVAIPGKNDVSYISVAIAYCDRRSDCFFLADGPGGSDRAIEVKPDDAKQFVESLPARSKNSAMFYPWIQVSDPVGVGRNPTRFVPPSGHVAGIFARTDVTRGVWKAPAGIEAVVSEAVGLQYKVVDAEQDLLNPVSLNCLRQFPGVGIVSWGSRTLSSDPEWRYVPVRRMGLFLKESLRRGLQWAVFEPNDEELWGRIAINIQSFMMTLFRQGAFQGSTPADAFTVVCDRSTNPQENIDAGIVTARVAFAPLKPAEFVVIEISQKSLLVS